MSKTAIEQILDFMQKKSSEKIDTDYGELFALTISKSCELLEVEKRSANSSLDSIFFLAITQN